MTPECWSALRHGRRTDYGRIGCGLAADSFENRVHLWDNPMETPLYCLATIAAGLSAEAGAAPWLAQETVDVFRPAEPAGFGAAEDHRPWGRAGR